MYEFFGIFKKEQPLILKNVVEDSQLLFYLMKAKHQQQLKSKKKKKNRETQAENPILFHDPCLHARAGNHSLAHATCTLTNICFFFFLL
jgi:Fe-S oxidoreductase